MPRKRKAARTFRSPDAPNSAEGAIVLLGPDLARAIFPKELIRPLPDLERVWKLNRVELMREWQANYAQPGVRPWAVWKFELKREQPSRCREQFAELRRLGLLDADELCEWEKRFNEHRS